LLAANGLAEAERRLVLRSLLVGVILGFG